MKKRVFSKVVISSVISAAMLGSVQANAGNLPAVDSAVTTTFDKSIIHGSLLHSCDDGTESNTCTGPLVYDKAGNARFAYTGKIYAVATDSKTGELVTLANQIGDITGEAAFPKMFVTLSTAVNGLMQQMMDGTWDGQMPQMPSVIEWTCNHCDMTVAGTRYLSIADVLDEDSPMYNAAMAAKFDQGLMDGASGALDNMRMHGRAFTGLTPATFDPATRTMGIRMAGCSALVAISGPNAGKMGTLCMNATAVFDVSGTKAAGMDSGWPIYDETSQISAEGSSNCVTVLHKPTM